MADNRYEREKAKKKERYREFKSKGICTWCKKEKAKKKERYREFKSKGICTQCRKEKAVPGFTSCKACRKKAREKKRIKAQSNRTTDTLEGVCEEVAKYNEEHGTAYSYGYYSALKSRGLI